MVKVKNKNRHIHADEYYYYASDEEGVDYLFSKAELEKASTRAIKNPEDIPVIENDIKFIKGFFTGMAILIVTYFLFLGI